MSPLISVKPLRITLLTHSTLPRGGVVHALSLGEALADAGHEVRLLAPVQAGEVLFRAPRCRFIGVPATPVSRVTSAASHLATHPTLANIETQTTHSASSDATSALPIDSDLEALVRLRIDDWLRYFDTTPEAFDADVFHAQDPISANALANLVEQGRLPGFVRTVHHLDVFANPQLAAWQHRGFHAATHVCCVSEVWRDTLRREDGIDAALVRNGVDRIRFSPEANEGDVALHSLRVECNVVSKTASETECNTKCNTERDANDTPRAPVFLSVGGVEARKNTVNALAAFILWREQQVYPSDAQWWIAGGASLLDHRNYGNQFLTMAETAGLRVGRTLHSDADIVLLGRIDDQHMPALFRAADALLFPSLVEGFGLVVLEALSVGTPVITSRIAPFTEYLPDAAVEWADPLQPHSIADAMQRSVQWTRASSSSRVASSALLDKEEASMHARSAQRKHAGFEVADSFSWAHSASQHSDLYRRWQLGAHRRVARDGGGATPELCADADAVAAVVAVPTVPLHPFVFHQESHHA